MGLEDTIADAINWKVPVVDGLDSILTVIELMNKENVTALAVKDKEENVIGIITDLDVIACITRRSDLSRVKTKDIMTTCELIVDKSVRSPCAQLDANETVFNAFSVMESAGVHHLLVSENANKVGMVSIANLLKIALD